MSDYLPLLLVIEKYQAKGYDFIKTKQALLADNFHQSDIDFIFSKFAFGSFTGSQSDAKQKLNLLSTNNSKLVGEALLAEKSQEAKESATVDMVASQVAPDTSARFAYTESFLNKLAISWWAWLGVLILVNTVCFGLVLVGTPPVVSFLIGNILLMGVFLTFLMRKST